MRGLLGALAILVNLCAGLFCLGLGLLGWIDGGAMIVPLMPVQPEKVASSLVSAGSFAIVASFLALNSKALLRFPMLLWSLGLIGVLVAAIFRDSYRFEGIEGLQRHGWMLLGSVVLAWASWCRWNAARKRPTPLYRSR